MATRIRVYKNDKDYDDLIVERVEVEIGDKTYVIGVDYGKLSINKICEDKNYRSLAVFLHQNNYIRIE